MTRPPQSPAAAARTSTRRMIAGVLFALGAALAYGTSQVLTRQVVQDLAPPLVGSFIAIFWGTLGFTVLSVRTLAQRGDRFWRGALFFVGAGIFSAGGVMLLFEALSRGQVVIVSPVAATNPLFTLVFAMLLLRDVERVTPRIVIGALLVVAGVIVLSRF